MESFNINRPYNSSTKILVSFPQELVTESWKACSVVWFAAVGAEISSLSNLSSKLPRFWVARKGQSPQWRHLVMLNDRYSREAPESGLSPRWWRNGSQLSNRLDNRRRWRRCLPEQDAVSVSANQGPRAGWLPERYVSRKKRQERRCHVQHYEHWRSAGQKINSSDSCSRGE